MNEPTDLAITLDRVASFVLRYVAMSDEQADAVALWIAHTHTLDAFELSPYLTFSSAEMRSGKTTAMKVLGLLVARPWRVITPSEAVVYRKIARDRPTVLLDEYDTIFGARDYEPLRALLNAGNEPGRTVPRCAGANRDQLQEFPIYCAKALAGIGKLPATVADRAIEIRLKRKRRDEQVERFRPREVRAEGAPLRQALVSLGEHYLDPLAEARPELPEELDDRAQDVWEALLAIADAAAADWPKRARRAAAVLSAADVREHDSSGVTLLADVRDVFDSRRVDRLTSQEICDDLHEIEESPLAQWYGKPLTPRDLAQVLKRYEIEPKPFRFGEQTLRGYERVWFVDAWARHLPESATPKQIGSEQGFAAESFPSIASDVAVREEAAKAHRTVNVADVADRDGKHAPELTAQEARALRDRVAPVNSQVEDRDRRERDAVIMAAEQQLDLGTASLGDLEDWFG